MGDETAVYNLGEVEAAVAAEKPQIRVVPANRQVHSVSRVRPIDAFTDSLELFIPGAGQLLRGRWSDGLAVLTATGFLLALAWAIWGTLDRLAATLTALGYGAAGGVYALAMVYVGLAGIHAGNVLYGTTRGSQRAHPIAAGLASALIPGWGQLINRQPTKAALFVAGLWAVGIAWLLASPWIVTLLDTYGLAFRPGFEQISSPLVLYTAPLVLWTLSIYDAVATSRK
jgi:TM2 domain-containing membrane protein YozV